MESQASFQCVGCQKNFPLLRPIYRCDDCGELLEVAHNIEALRQKSGMEWRSLFESRWRQTQWPYGSGVWGKKEWVQPGVENKNVVSTFEGGTNLFWAKRYGEQLGLPQLWVKQCGNSHTGSFKDLGMTVLVSTVKQMISEGVGVNAIACASTGDTSAALSAYAAAAGIPALVLLPKGKISTAQLVQPLANGAIVMALETDFDGCMEIVQRLVEDEGIYLANSMNSLRLEGQKTVGIEIAQQFEWEVPDWIVIPGGNLGNVSALGAGFLMMQDLGVVNRLPKICVAQAEHANPLYLASQTGFETFAPVKAKTTLASAIQIGNPVSYKRAVRVLKKFGGVVEQASEEELANAAAKADRTGLFNCPHTGVALAAVEKLRARDQIRSSDRVVVISTAHGLKFSDFKVGYHEQRHSDVSRFTHANAPHVLPPIYETVRAEVKKRIGSD